MTTLLTPSPIPTISSTTSAPLVAGAARPAVRFADLGLAGMLVEAVAAEGYDTPTPIQAQAIPHAVAGRDILGCAQTGTGKTAAFALPTLHRLHVSADKAKRNPALPRALVLSPTRELATQIADSFHTYGRGTRVRQAVIFGGVSQHHQVRALRAGVDVIVATPGRLMDLMDQGYVNLTAVEVFVLDEADRMLDMGFINPIRRISAALPVTRQTMLFSATMPTTIARLADSLLRSPVKVAVTPVASAAPKIAQSVYMVDQQGKAALLTHFLAEEAVERALVFTRTKHGAERLATALARVGVAAQAIHGNKSQSQRQRALDAFRDGRSRVLVATDVAARGLDVDGVSHVFNYNLPNEPEAYVHRIGRTGRAGALGIAISFCDHEERGFLKSIERLTGVRIPVQVAPSDLRGPTSGGVHGRQVNIAPVESAVRREPAGGEGPGGGGPRHSRGGAAAGRGPSGGARGASGGRAGGGPGAGRPSNGKPGHGGKPGSAGKAGHGKPPAAGSAGHPAVRRIGKGVSKPRSAGHRSSGPAGVG